MMFLHMVADKVADTEVHMVADTKVDKVAAMTSDMAANNFFCS